VIAIYVVGAALSGAIRINPTDLDAFFLPSARIAVAGDPLNAYSVRHDGVYPNANGPLSLVPLTGVAALASLSGVVDDFQRRRILVMATFAIFSLLLAREAVLAIDRLRGRRTAGGRRLLLHLVFAAAPLVWQSVLLYGHIEQPLCLWLTLFGVRAMRDDRPRRAGLLFGLAVLTRSVACLLILPILLRLFVRPRGAGRRSTACLAFGTISIGLAPFLVAHGADTIYSLIGYRSSLPVGGGSIWFLGLGTPVEGWAQRADGIAVVLLVALVAGIVLWRRPASGSSDDEVYGLLALSAVSFPLLAKTVWPYYLLDVYILATVWALGSWHRRTVRGMRVAWLVPALITGCGLTAELGVTATLAPVWRRAESAGMFITLASLAVVFTLTLIRGYGSAVGSGTAPGELGTEAGGGAPAGGVGTPPGGRGTAGVAGAGVDVGPNGGPGQLARAALKGVEDGRGVGVVPAGGLTYGV